MSGAAALVISVIAGLAVIILPPLWPYLFQMMHARGLKRTQARRWRAGLCPACAYDRRGLAPDAPCPECGAPGGPPPTAAR